MGFVKGFFEDSDKGLMISFDGYGLVEYVIMKLGASKYYSSHFFLNLGPFYFIFTESARRLRNGLTILN